MGLPVNNPKVSWGTSVNACCFQPLDFGGNFLHCNRWLCTQWEPYEFTYGMIETWNNCPLTLLSPLDTDYLQVLTYSSFCADLQVAYGNIQLGSSASKKVEGIKERLVK